MSKDLLVAVMDEDYKIVKLTYWAREQMSEEELLQIEEGRRLVVVEDF